MAELNDLIHQPIRLRIVAALAALDADESVDFTFLRDLLGLTDGNFGSHLRKLDEAGYVHLDKTFVGRKPRTYPDRERPACLPGSRRCPQGHSGGVSLRNRGWRKERDR